MSLILGDCLDVMAAMEPESVDAVVTDPPYNLTADTAGWRGKTGADFNGRPDLALRGRGFMGKVWDGTGIAFRPETWALALRVAKPSAYLLAFGGTRTVHRMTVAIEDAGWIIRDMLVWAYASGFPKSKASLKPAWEPIVMARKPGPLRELAIDACRIGTDGEVIHAPQSDPTIRTGKVQVFGDATLADREAFQRAQRESIERTNTLGRWPANVILTDPIFDGGWDGVVGGGMAPSAGRYREPDEPSDRGVRGGTGGQIFGFLDDGQRSNAYANDSGTYSRFFLIPKADRADREPVLGGLPTKRWTDGRKQEDKDYPSLRGASERQNSHPTVKPVDLMRHLVRLVTPTGGRVLDPFAGSGSTLLAAEMEGFEWIGIEKEAEYVAIAEARLNGTQRGLGLPA